MIYVVGLLCSFWAAVIFWAIGAPAWLFLLALIPLAGITLLALAPRLLAWTLDRRLNRMLRSSKS